MSERDVINRLDRLSARFDENHRETQLSLSRLTDKVDKTNGRVTSIEAWKIRIETLLFSDPSHELMTRQRFVIYAVLILGSVGAAAAVLGFVFDLVGR